MKVAIVHDYIKEYGGAERVLEVLHEMYPKAPVYTLVYAPKFLGPHKDRFRNWDIRESWVGSIPLAYKLISPLRIIAPFIFRSFDFSGIDIVIVSATGAYNPNIINKKKAKQICYCHTPPRYLYGYATAREPSKNPVYKSLLAIMLHILRIVDGISSRNVDQFIANSQNVKRRIEKFYRRDAKVVYPPVDTGSQFIVHSSQQGKRSTMNNEQTNQLTSSYYLTGGRLARPKHVDLIVKACTELKLPLKVFGKSFAGYGDMLQKAAGKTVEFLGEVRDEEKYALMRGAKAFLFASEDEDFGIIPVEAMGCGTPVIAYRSGGVLETVVEGETGVFFDELTVTGVMGGIKKFEALRQAQGKYFNREEIIKHAKKFAKERFKEQIQKVVETM